MKVLYRGLAICVFLLTAGGCSQTDHLAAPVADPTDEPTTQPTQLTREAAAKALTACIKANPGPFRGLAEDAEHGKLKIEFRNDDAFSPGILTVNLKERTYLVMFLYGNPDKSGFFEHLHVMGNFEHLLGNWVAAPPVEAKEWGLGGERR